MRLVRSKSPYLSLLVVGMLPLAALAADRVALRSRLAAGAVAEVTLHLEADGELAVEVHSTGAGAGEAAHATAKPTKLSMKASGDLKFEERRLRGEQPLAARKYEQADALVRVGDDSQRPKLDDQRTLLVAGVDDEGLQIACPTATLTRDEFEVVTTPCDPLVVDELLPGREVVVGDTWPTEPTALARVLALDTVSVAGVECVLTEANQRYARVELAGTAHGVVDGAATEVEVRGIYVFDQHAGRVTQLNLALREQRQIGPASPGVTANTKVKLVVTPKSQPTLLTDAAIAKLPKKLTAEACRVATESDSLGCRLVHGTQWYVTGLQPRSMTLRQVDGTGMAMQCSVARIAGGEVTQQQTLAQLRRDLQSQLGSNFGQFTSEKEWLTATGLRGVRVVAIGKVSEVPVEWRSYVLGDDQGNRVSLSFTLEQAAAERAGKGDEQLVESIELFAPRTTATAQQPSATASK